MLGALNRPRAPQPRRGGGFTLVELLIVVALVALVLTFAAPALSEFIRMQRLRSVNAQLTTDLQFARSEAVSRRVEVHMRFRGPDATAQMSCYIIYTRPTGANACNCLAPEGSRCVAPAQEIRTVQAPTNLSVNLAPAPQQADHFAFDPRNGGIMLPAVDIVVAVPDAFSVDTYIDGARKLRDTVGLSGRVKVCAPAGSTMQVQAC